MSIVFADPELIAIHSAALELRSKLTPCVRSRYKNVAAVVAAIRGSAFERQFTDNNNYFRYINQFTEDTEEKKLHHKLQEWIASHTSELSDIENPEGWLRLLKEDFKDDSRPAAFDLRPTAFEYTLKKEYQELQSAYEKLLRKNQTLFRSRIK
jgi:hypothetical protein